MNRVNRTKRLLTIQVAPEEPEEGTVGNCLPLCLLWVQLRGPGTKNRTKRQLTIQVALEEPEEGAVGSCLPPSLLWVQLCQPGTQNLEITHHPGCSGEA